MTEWVMTEWVMVEWVMAEEQEETDPAGRQVDDDAAVHAYAAKAGEAAHPVTRLSYTVRAEMPWNAGAAPTLRGVRPARAPL